MKFNTLASPTYSWLKMNGGELLDLPAMERLSPAIELPEGVRVEKLNGVAAKPLRTGGGAEFGEALAAAKLPVLICTVPEGQEIAERDALRLSFRLPDAGQEYNPRGRNSVKGEKASGTPAKAGKFAQVELNLERESSLTVVMDYLSEADAKGLAGVQTKVMLGEGAKLTLVQLVRAGSGYTFLNDVGAVCAKNAELHVIHLVLSGKHVYQGFSSAMEGDRSQLAVDVGYVGEDRAHYDFNYESIHSGKKTGAEIHGKGILRGHAKKVFRDSIDLRNGCSGSEGNETEDVLLMDETVENRSLPIILCSEDDVVGNHGATIGRLDEDLLFYMESRGMQKDEIYEMMAKARIDAIVRKIPDAKTRHDLLELDDEEEREDR